MLGEHLRRRDLLNVALLIGGVSLLVVVAPPRTTAAVATPRLAAVLAALALLVLLALLLTFRPGRLDRGTLMIAAAGGAFAFVGVATKLLSDALSRRAWITCVLWGLATAAAGAIGLLAEMNALQLRAASTVASLIFALETAVPVALSPILFGEAGTAAATTLCLRAIALAATMVAAVTLTRTSSVVEALSE